MAEPNNPAGRLLEVVRKARGIPSGENGRTAWARLLDLDPNDLSIVSARWGRVCELPAKISAGLHSVPTLDLDLYLKWAPDFDKFLNHLSLTRPWGECQCYLTDITVNRLEFCDETLRRYRPEKKLTSEWLDARHKEVIEIIEEVICLGEEYSYHKTYLLKYLHLIEQALNDYQFVGVEELKSTIWASVGEFAFRSDLRNAAEGKSQNVWKRFAIIAWTILTTVTDVQDVAKLPHEVGTFLGNTIESVVSMVPGSETENGSEPEGQNPERAE